LSGTRQKCYKGNGDGEEHTVIVEVSTHGSTIKRDHDSFVIKIGDERTDIPAEKISSIIVTANCLVSTAAMKLAMEKQIHMVFASWSGRPFARVWASTQGKATDLRRWQYLNQNTQIGLKISKDIVTKKISLQKKLLTELKNNRKHSTVEINNALQTIRDAIQKIKQENEITKDTLLGLEGWSAKHYFMAVSSILPKKWQFRERSQHPARDEFNAMLNYAYGIAYSSVEKIIILSGLEPNAGFYHADSYGKPTLSFDIIEIVRTRVDRIVISLFTKRMVRENWFEIQNDGSIFLTKNGRMTIIAKYTDNSAKLLEKDVWNYCRRIIKIFEKSATQ